LPKAIENVGNALFQGDWIMQIINRFDVELRVSTFNTWDVLEWVPFAVYHAPPNSNIYVRAHDHGRCKLRFEWSEYGGREIGVVSENDVLVLVPPPTRPKPWMEIDRETGEPDELSEFLAENEEKIRTYYFDLPWHRPDQPPQLPR
jgi:hypothetical protein